MKVKVNRQLNSGIYHVNFEVTDFTSEELVKMERFGIPYIKLLWKRPTGGVAEGRVPLNTINRNYDAPFYTEEEAKNYEKDVLTQLRAVIQNLREQEDKYTSSDEVAL